MLQSADHDLIVVLTHRYGDCQGGPLKGKHSSLFYHDVTGKENRI